MNLRTPFATVSAVLASLTVLFTVLITAGCGTQSGESSGGTLTVYSASGLADWYEPQFEKFTRETGIKVTLFEAGSGELVSRVNSRPVWERLDGDTPVPPADLLVALPPFIQKAAKAGILQPSGADTSGISSKVIDPDGLFVPIVDTALCFIASPAAEPQPVTWDDLLRPGLVDKLQYSTPGEAGDGTAMLLLLQHLMGKDGALDYLAKLEANNVGPSSSTGALQPKVAAGEILVANGDVQMNLAAITNDGSNFGIFFPAMPDGTRTTVALPYLAAVPAEAPNPDAAKKLLAFLLSEQAQRDVVSQAAGIPVLEAAAGATADPGEPTPSEVLRGVRLWTPDWNAVLSDLDSDLEAYKQATSG